MLVDTHCHINFDSYDSDREAVISRAAGVGVKTIIIPAVDLPSCQPILELTQKYSGLYAAVGVHPNSTVDFTQAMLAEIESLAGMEKVVAIGEIGLDYHWRESPKETQWKAFEAQLELEKRLELPVIIRNREASDDVIAMLEQWTKDLPPKIKERPGVLHSFSAPEVIAERALAAGFYLGFTGPITYKNADQLRHIAANVPLDRILVETDGPFLTPVPYRGKRNEPSYIPLIVERLANLRQLDAETFGAATTQNAIRLFALPQ
jgi:TatD DNase family protein